MTHSQLEHLKLIDAHLERLLAIAEKRTAGEWGVEQTDTTNWIGPLRHDRDKIDVIVCDTDREGLKLRAVNQNDANAAFIASCAGNAEAGWRATRAAIAGLLLIAQFESDGRIVRDESFNGRNAEKTLESILAAFPLELIQKP